MGKKHRRSAQSVRGITWWLGFVLAASACSSDVVDTSAPTSTVPASTITAISAGEDDAPADDGRRMVILDYSPTVSDIGALVFVATHPDLHLLAVTLPGRGESSCSQGVSHTRGVLIELGFPELPVACSESNLPLEGRNAFPVFWQQGANSLNLPDGEPNETRFAPQLIIDTVNETDLPIEILAVGPLTNLAVAFDEDPTLAGRLDGVTIMGGAVDVEGNVLANEVAEWNIWVDPVAAQQVFASGVDLTVVPLDATSFLPANSIFFNALDSNATSPGSRTVRDLIASDEFWLAGGFFFWDELAAAVLADESIVTFETMNLLVDTEPEAQEGRTREDPSASVARVAVAADRVAFEQLYLETLIGQPVELGYIEATPEEVAYLEAADAITSDTDAAIQVVLDEVSAGLGEVLDSEDGFLIILREAAPAIFVGPLTDQLARIEGLEAPESLRESHADWVQELRRFIGLDEEFVTAIDDGFEGLDPFFEPMDEACSAIQAEVEQRQLDIEIAC